MNDVQCVALIAALLEAAQVSRPHADFAIRGAVWGDMETLTNAAVQIFVESRKAIRRHNESANTKKADKLWAGG